MGGRFKGFSKYRKEDTACTDTYTFLTVSYTQLIDEFRCPTLK